ncbi:MAG: VOC family protein [Leptospiraceae bacterium]|nr:VOC family protein [Leptospiraceae bacterium]
MELGAFSVSLAVKDIGASREFYGKLGFEEFGGNIKENWLILKNGDCLIGLFQGMFEGNILTFNPGWDQNAEELQEFADVRAIQKSLKDQGIQLLRETPDDGSGIGSLTLIDPDGNAILIDQHVG